MVLENALLPMLESPGEDLSALMRTLYHSTPLTIYLAHHLPGASAEGPPSSASNDSAKSEKGDPISQWESQQLSALDEANSSQDDEKYVPDGDQRNNGMTFWELLREERRKVEKRTNSTSSTQSGTQPTKFMRLNFAESDEVLTDQAVLTLQSLIDNMPPERRARLSLHSINFSGCFLLTDKSVASLFGFLARNQHQADEMLHEPAGTMQDMGSSHSTIRRREKNKKLESTRSQAMLFPEEIDLAHCARVTDAALLQIVLDHNAGSDRSYRPNRRLRCLRLDSCTAVTSTGIAALLTHCPHLEKIEAQDCKAISWPKKIVTHVRGWLKLESSI